MPPSHARGPKPLLMRPSRCRSLPETSRGTGSSLRGLEGSQRVILNTNTKAFPYSTMQLDFVWRPIHARTPTEAHASCFSSSLSDLLSNTLLFHRMQPELEERFFLTRSERATGAFFWLRLLRHLLPLMREQKTTWGR